MFHSNCHDTVSTVINMIDINNSIMFHSNSNDTVSTIINKNIHLSLLLFSPAKANTVLMDENVSSTMLLAFSLAAHFSDHSLDWNCRVEISNLQRILEFKKKIHTYIHPHLHLHTHTYIYIIYTNVSCRRNAEILVNREEYTQMYPLNRCKNDSNERDD